MTEFPNFDDVGSFPLPENIDKDIFANFYWKAYSAITNNIDVFSHRGILSNVIEPIYSSFRKKLNAGVEVINYPQHMNMYDQFLKPLEEYKKTLGLIEKEKAIIPEINYIEKFAKENYEKTQEPLDIKICVSGPIELYIKRHSFTIYEDMALNYAKSINHFIKNSLRSNKCIKTSTISIDEPSFGYVDLVNVEDDTLIRIFDKCLENIDCVSQIHLHTLNRSNVPLQTENIDVLTCEYASDHSNLIPKNLLDEYDKYIRVGITRTDINGIMAEKLDRGVSHDELKTYNGLLSLIDSEEQIEENLKVALNHYKDRLRFIGPDCGLSGWTPPQLAFELLSRTARVIHKVQNSYNA
ncbi:MAG: putative 5-methyltetrahydropteroyltriglutamate--homocysteine methyltransferase [Promethearchaeota archaeon]|nr:MAG: putative 5-methyltetrahydropteroyltriglutamate--homocysteine methyltransferase [Candidatus Lokiarchaeota archaeon]